MDGLKFTVSVVVGIVAFMACGIATGNWLARASCEAEWAGSGHAIRYGFFQGCLVDVGGGKFLPEKVLRKADFEAAQ